MADGPKDYRDPKVTTRDSRKSSMKWLWYVLGALVVLLLLAWLLGWFATDDEALLIEEPGIGGNDTTIVVPD